MKCLNHLLGLALIMCVTTATFAQSKQKQSPSAFPDLSIRAKAIYETPNPSDKEVKWMRIIYRIVDLNKPKNAALYYPEEPIDEQRNLFRILMSLLTENKIVAYDYLDGREVFTDQYKLNFKDMLDRFHIIYKEKEGSSTKKPQFTIEDSDVPSNEVLSYYIKEKWVFDQRQSNFYTVIEAICPVLQRQGDFGTESTKYPMFWVPYESIRPYLAQNYVMNENSNNALHYNYDDFFRLRMYEGDIYKTVNLKNQTLMQMYPGDSALTQARLKLEEELKMFDKKLWVAEKKLTDDIKSGKSKSKSASVTDEEKDSKSKKTTRTSRGSAKSESSPTSKKETKEQKSPVKSVRRSR